MDKMNNTIMRIILVQMLLAMILGFGACGCGSEETAMMPTPQAMETARAEKYEITMQGYEEAARIIMEAEMESIQKEEAAFSLAGSADPIPD